MGNRALKKENERLRGELLEASRKICDLRVVNKRYEDELADSKEKYAELLEKYIAMMEVKLNSHCVYEKKIKDVKIIVREHEMRPDFTDDFDSLVMKEMSTVAVKFRYAGIEYGDYIVLDKPTLDVSDVVDVANELFVSLLSALDQPQEVE